MRDGAHARGGADGSRGATAEAEVNCLGWGLASSGAVSATVHHSRPSRMNRPGIALLAAMLSATLAKPSAAAPTIHFAAPELVDDSALAHPPAGPGTGVPENFHNVGERWLVGRLGPSPLGWAVPAPASQPPRWAVGSSVGSSEGFVSDLRAPAGNASTAAELAAARAATYYVQLAGGGVRYASSVGSEWRGDARWHIPDFFAANLSAGGWSSRGALTLSVGAGGVLTQSVDGDVKWRWHGVPAPGMNVTASHCWVAPRIYRVLPLPAGGYVAAVALVFNGQRVGAEGPELSIVAFTSSDGLDFQFSAVVVNASSGARSQTHGSLCTLILAHQSLTVRLE